VTGLDENGGGDCVYEHLRRNLIGNLIWYCQKKFVANDHVFAHEPFAGKMQLVDLR